MKRELALETRTPTRNPGRYRPWLTSTRVSQPPTARRIFAENPRPAHNGSATPALISSIDKSAVTLCTFTSEISAW